MAYKITTEMAVELVASISAPSHSLDLELTFDVYPGYEMSQWQPGEPASVSVKTAHVIDCDGRYPAPSWLLFLIENDDVLESEMLSAAWADEEAARDDHADMLREERLLEKRA